LKLILGKIDWQASLRWIRIRDFMACFAVLNPRRKKSNRFGSPGDRDYGQPANDTAFFPENAAVASWP
jgi:hypothetical protein